MLPAMTASMTSYPGHAGPRTYMHLMPGTPAATRGAAGRVSRERNSTGDGPSTVQGTGYAV